MITYNGVLVVGQPKDDISDFKSLRDVAMATKVWPTQALLTGKMPFSKSLPG